MKMREKHRLEISELMKVLKLCQKCAAPYIRHRAINQYVAAAAAGAAAAVAYRTRSSIIRGESMCYRLKSKSDN